MRNLCGEDVALLDSYLSYLLGVISVADGVMGQSSQQPWDWTQNTTNQNTPGTWHINEYPGNMIPKRITPHYGLYV